jgi:hypothetical protein
MGTSISALIAIGLCALLLVIYHQFRQIRMLRKFNDDAWKIVDLRREAYYKLHLQYDELIKAISSPDADDDLDDEDLGDTENNDLQ